MHVMGKKMAIFLLFFCKKNTKKIWQFFHNGYFPRSCFVCISLKKLTDKSQYVKKYSKKCIADVLCQF